ncbi:MAG TPA: nucleotidyltransferase family protein [Bacteroidales bacterium]|nr:nucleotidyltransferase family protein [Bacteroidales bacterium]
MINEAVILAGGLGTRLRTVISDLPKPMAPVGGRPFISYLLDYLDSYKIRYSVIASGFMHETIEPVIGRRHGKMSLVYSPEHEPLGTGGAILNSTDHIKGADFFVLNGDTFFDVDLQAFEKSHLRSRAVMSLAVKHMDDTSRYGSLVLQDDRIVSFREKGISGSGYINGGIYILNKEWFASSAPGRKFSLEKDILERMAGSSNITAFASDGYFTDIGVPEDYRKACSELPRLRSVRR